MNSFKKWVCHASHTSRKSKARLQVEALESRLVPCALSGNAWPQPALITISFVPDGTSLGNMTSNLFATFDARWPTATWQGQILKAAQQWAAATNINFAVVSDSGAPTGSGNYEQGDPTMGDIRIGGFNFGSNDLAGASLPPPVNNFSVAGDIDFNTAQPFNIGTTYDLYSVAMHEFGHALGLLHSTAYGAVMNAAYKKATGLGTDDVAGVRANYSGARATDRYLGLNITTLTAASVPIDSNSLTGQLTNLNLANAGQVEYFSVVIPQGTNGTFNATVQSAGLSMLAPTVTLYSGLLGSRVGFASGAGQYGTTVSVTLNGVSAGQVYYIKVTGADSSAFGTGAYALTVNAGPNPSPAVPLPNTQTPNGSPLHAGGGQPEVIGNVGVANNTGHDMFNPTEGVVVSQMAGSVGTYLVTGQFVHQATGAYASAGLPFHELVGVAPAPRSTSLSDGRPIGTAHITISQESGGGGIDTAVDAALPAIMPAVSEPEAPPAQVPASGTNQASLRFSGFEWCEACTACFSQQEVQRLASDQEMWGQASGRQDIDSAAALLGSFLVLGGYWGGYREQIPEGRQRSTRLPQK